MQDYSSGTGRVIRFDVFEVDLAARQLKKAQTAGQSARSAVSASSGTLGAARWNRNEGVDDGLHTAARKLREVLGDSVTRPRFIGTVPRQGYCFLAPVSLGEVEQEKAPNNPGVPPSEAAPAAAAEEIPVKPVLQHPAARSVWMVCVSLFVLACIGVVFTRSRHASSPPSDVVSVAPRPRHERRPW